MSTKKTQSSASGPSKKASAEPIKVSVKSTKVTNKTASPQKKSASSVAISKVKLPASNPANPKPLKPSSTSSKASPKLSSKTKTTPIKKVKIDVEEEDDEFFVAEDDDHEQILVPIEEGEIKCKFYIPSKGRYVVLRTMIAPSTIPGAGMGVFAVDKIPRGAEIKYEGVKKGQNTANFYYSWEVKTYDPETGEPDDEDILYYIDASDTKYSNCTRTVNCGMMSKANNMDAIQRFDEFYYIALRDIKPGEELFVDYGEQYRKVNLGLKGRY